MGSLVNAITGKAPKAPTITTEVKKEPTVDESAATAEDMVSRRRRARYGMAQTVTARNNAGGGLSGGGLGETGAMRKTLG